MSALFYYKFLSFTELLAAEILLSFRKEKKKHFFLRLFCSVIFMYAFVYFFPLPNSIAYTGWYSSLMFLCFFALTLFFLKYIYQITWNNVLFIAVSGYTIKHFSYMVFNLLSVLLNFDSTINIYSASVLGEELDYAMLFYFIMYFSVYLFFYTVLYFLIGQRINQVEETRMKTLHIVVVSAFAVLVDIVLNSFVVYGTGGKDAVSKVIDSCFNILCCLLVFYVLLNLIEIKEVETENQMISRMLKEAETQYDFHKENIELLNIKCHDMKHQIRTLLNNKNMEQSEIDKINNAIDVYATLYKTGNEALDIILSEKSLLCHSKDIAFTCMADGKALSFLNDVDLYALFGNLLDNAIEATEKVDKEHRNVALNVRKVGSFVSVTVKNNYVGNLKFSEEGLPITTKKKSAYHGIGLKSVRLIAERYNGNLSIVTENGIFKINILFLR